MAGINFDAKGQMTGVTWMGGGIGPLSVKIALLLIKDADALPFDIEDGLMMLSELERTGPLTGRQRAHIKRALAGQRLIWLQDHRKMCWGKKRPPATHFWWFDQKDWV